MNIASVSHAKNNLSALLKEVRGGATYVITDHGVPVARLGPVVATKGVPPSALELASHGLLVLPAKPPAARWLDLPLPALEPGVDPVALVIDERAGGW